jgi:serine/threonine protein kinase
MTVIGNYRIVRLIGEGGFGRTYEAMHTYLEERSCLKQNINMTPEDEALLRQEAKLLWNVHHHSLPAMRDYFKAPDGSFIMAMSFVEGKTLEQAVKKHTAIHPEDVSWITQRLLNALHYLHSKGVVHGDVKPPNVIVQPAEHNAVLVDYGLASLRPHRDTKPVGYTAVFAAPEIMDGKPPLPESDLYSLGLTMIYTLGGDPIAKTMPDAVPEKLREFYNDLVRYNPVDRPNWEKQDLVRRLSDIRLETFGRRSSGEK